MLFLREAVIKGWIVTLMVIGTSCREEATDVFLSSEVQIAGSETISFASESSKAGTSESASVLTEGSQGTLFATGGITSDSCSLTLSNGFWKTETPLQWMDHETPAKVVVFSPSLPEDIRSFYTPENQLTDVLIAQGNYASHAPITLRFKHAFSKMDFHIDPLLNQQITSFKVIPDVILTGIDPYSAEIHTQRLSGAEAAAHEVSFLPCESGTYSLLLPPDASLSMQLSVTTSDGKAYQKTLGKLNCCSGETYTCSIRLQKKGTGISTAEDFIAFTHLINGQAYKHRSLAEFYEEKNGRRIFKLTQSIRFTEEERKQVLPIGNYKEKRSFNDWFDGQGFSLENLLILPNSDIVSGLFHTLGSKGLIRSLTLRNAQTQESAVNASTGTALLCGLNEGTITDCRICSSQVSIGAQDAAGFVLYNSGTLKSCQIEGSTLQFTHSKKVAMRFGGMVERNEGSGKILNCGANHLSAVPSNGTSSRIAAICHENNGIISNCVSEFCNAPLHPLCGENRAGISAINYCYVPHESYGANLNGDNATSKELQSNHIYSFLGQEGYRNSVVKLLNQWISQTGAKAYPNFLFTPWKVASGTLITLDYR